jgi:Arc/MetJ-type ribon-helix-helix transcriptional regulator
MPTPLCNIHCRLPATLVARLEELIESGRFVSRSEALRAVVQLGLDVLERDATSAGRRGTR